MAWPITTGDVTGYMGITPASSADGLALDRATAASVRWIESNVLPTPLPDPVGADVELGAVMLAARWYSRRNSSQGIAAFAELGVSYVTRHDPDIARLLGLGRPSVG